MATGRINQIAVVQSSARENRSPSPHRLELQSFAVAGAPRASSFLQLTARRPSDNRLLSRSADSKVSPLISRRPLARRTKSKQLRKTGRRRHFAPRTPVKAAGQTPGRHCKQQLSDFESQYLVSRPTPPATLYLETRLSLPSSS